MWLMNNGVLGRNNGCDGKRAKFFEENKLALPNILLTSFLEHLNQKTIKETTATRCVHK
jgi:hypothetical protein